MQANSSGWILNRAISGVRHFITSAFLILFGFAGHPPLWAVSLFPNQLFSTGEQPRSVAIGDFNGDGIKDLATANYGSSDVSILLGRGDGTYSPDARFRTVDLPGTILLADFNGDGKPDLATASFYSEDISVLLSVGDGTFGPETRFNAAGSPYGDI